jgi:ribosome-binding protein aMBF1 (putative translation factor)
MEGEKKTKRRAMVRTAVLHVRPEYERLGEWIRSVRETAGLQQKPLSRAIGKPEQFLNKVEQGRQRIDVVEFVDLLRAMKFEGDIPVSELYQALSKGRSKR